MKEKMLPVLKKIAVILIASLMILGVVPISMVTMRNHTVDAKGAFIRLSPEQEASALQPSAEAVYRFCHQEKNVLPLGESGDGYLRFSLEELLENKDLKEIKEATLRLTFLDVGNQASMPARLWLMQEENWDSRMTYRTKPLAFGEIMLAELTPEFSGQEARVMEVDLTSYFRRYIKEGRTRISLHLDGVGDNIVQTVAGTSYEDSDYRPCLKVVCGEAVDPDSDDISKYELVKTAQSGKSTRQGMYRIGDGSDLYLRFALKPENIHGAMYQSNLTMALRQVTPEMQLKVYQLQQADWNEGDVLPQGKEALVGTAASLEEMEHIDLTDAINDAYVRGETFLTLRLTGEGGGYAILESTPRLRIRVSDHPDAVAVTEAAIYALEENPSPDAISGKLSDSYTTEHGVKAEIRWKSWDPETEQEGTAFLDKTGTVTQPRWYENSRLIHARATISAGEYHRDRVYRLTILPEEVPEVFDEKLDNYLDLGEPKDETQQQYAAKGGEKGTREVGGERFSYRIIDQDTMLAMTMQAKGEEQNYLTFKVWKGDTPTESLRIENLKHRDESPMSCSYPGEITPEEGFLYLTYPIPVSWTEGETAISFRICPEKGKDGGEPWNIYAIYTHQTPNFDPLLYADQGERFAVAVQEKKDWEETFKNLLRRLYHRVKDGDLSFSIFRSGEETEPSDAVLQEDGEKEFVWIDRDPSLLAFETRGDSVVISMPEDGVIAYAHRGSAYYDTYAQLHVKTYQENLRVIDYGSYQILHNTSRREYRVPWREEGLAGIYRDVAQDSYYAFLQDGQLADDSVLPQGAVLENGDALRIKGGRTMVLEQVAEPLYRAAWRISAVNEGSVSRMKLTDDLTISQVTVKSGGTPSVEKERLQVICCSYENGRLAEISRKTLETTPDTKEYRVELTPITVKIGQTLKIFVASADQPPTLMEPALQLP